MECLQKVVLSGLEQRLNQCQFKMIEELFAKRTRNSISKIKSNKQIATSKKTSDFSVAQTIYKLVNSYKNETL